MTHGNLKDISPIDYRYYDEKAAEFLSEEAYIKYLLLVEIALAETLAEFNVCSEKIAAEIKKACFSVSAEEVYEEENRIGHDIRALVNCIRNKVSEEAKPFVHMTSTSYDIIDPANAVRFRDAVVRLLIPILLELEKILIQISSRETDTIQVGRTHGQHAVPITFGFAIAGYVSRLGNSIKMLQSLAEKLPGKFSGAVGGYNASSLFFENPEIFEAKVLEKLGLIPAEHSTQIVPREPLVRLFSEVTIVMGILADLSDDMRHLQRTEIGEVGEKFEKSQVGSSTMPQKRNPINFENVKGMWKIVVSKILTTFMDQLSEHQRDLTNSVSGRTYGEIIAYTASSAKRLVKTMRKLEVDHENMNRNFSLQKGLIIAEPLYIILAALGHPDAHEKVRKMTIQAQQEKRSLEEIAFEDDELKEYLSKITPYQKKILSDPSLYVGITKEKTAKIVNRWRQEFKF